MKRMHRGLTAALVAVLVLAMPLGGLAAVQIDSYAALAAFATAGPTLANNTYEDIIITADIIYDETSTTVEFTGNVSIASEEGEHYTIGYAKDNDGNYVVSDAADRVQLIAVGEMSIYSDPYSLKAANLTFTGGNADGADATSRNGGAVFVIGDATVENCVFEGNYARNNGGGLYASKDATITGSTFTGNEAGYLGGGLFAAHGGGGSSTYKVTISDSTFAGNKAGGGGGGVFSEGDATISGSTFTDNSAESDGGGLNAQSVDITGSTFTGNEADGDGGGVCAVDAATITGSTFADNSAGENGGGLIASNVDITDSTFTGNEADGDGGGVYIDNYSAGASTITDTDFYNNTADADGDGSGEGGAIYGKNNPTLTMEGENYFSGNTPAGNAPDGDAVYGIYFVNGQLTVNGALIAGVRSDPGPGPKPEPEEEPFTDTGHIGGEPPARERAAEIVNCSEWVYLRGDPSTDNAPEGRILLGSRVTVYGYVGGFAQIIYNNTAYYVHGDYVALR